MKKIKSKKGFTLVEMLACIVTLLLIGLIVTTGMNLATMSMREKNFESNSQMLEETLNMYIVDILRYAIEVEEKEDGIQFTNDTYYIDDGMFIIDESVCDEIAGAGYLMCTSELDDEDAKGTLVANQGLYAGNLFIKDFVLTYDAQTGVFCGNYVIVSTATETTKLCEFTYRTIAAR